VGNCAYYSGPYIFRGIWSESVANQRFKPWGRREPAAHDTTGGDEGTPPAEPGDSPIVQRVLAATASSDAETAPDEPRETAPAEQAEEAPAEPATVGEEVGFVLKSAQEAAERIRTRARKDAALIREEAKAAAAGVEEAQRRAEADRADAESARAEAEAYAQQLRADAERESEQILDQARLRLERAEREAEERQRRAEEDVRERHATLEAESARYQERLEKMLGVFKGMTSQLEELLPGEPAEETLDEALRPDEVRNQPGDEHGQTDADHDEGDIEASHR